MTKKIRIIFLAIIFFVLLFFTFWQFLSRDQKVEFVNSEGKKIIVQLPRFPGMRLVSSEKNDCEFKASYVYYFYKSRDLSKYIIDSMTEGFILKNWQAQEETNEGGFNVFVFYKKQNNILETAKLKIGFVENQGTMLFLDYKRSPCP